RAFCSTSLWISPPISDDRNQPDFTSERARFGPSSAPFFGAKRAFPAAPLRRFCCSNPDKAHAPCSRVKAHHEAYRCPWIEDRPGSVRFHRERSDTQNRYRARCILEGTCRHNSRSCTQKSRTAQGPRHLAEQDRWLASRPQGQAVRHQCLHRAPERDWLSSS